MPLPLRRPPKILPLALAAALLWVAAPPPAAAWYKHVASPRYHTVGRASGLLMGVRRSPYLWRRHTEEPGAPPRGGGGRRAAAPSEEARAPRWPPRELHRRGPAAPGTPRLPPPLPLLRLRTAAEGPRPGRSDLWVQAPRKGGRGAWVPQRRRKGWAALCPPGCLEEREALAGTLRKPGEEQEEEEEDSIFELTI